MSTAETPLIRLEGVTKSFGPVRANNDISFDIHGGRILALLGENGAGKSTLMSILAGRLHPDAGRILVRGRETRFASPKDSIAAGIGMVYQSFMLVNAMTVAENVLLGQEKTFWLSRRAMEREVGELARRFNLPIDPGARIADLSMGERQLVEILKLLYRQSQVLIFDEPTAVLTPVETAHLFEALWKMAEQGKAIIFISHKMEEVIAVADDVAVLRGGEVVGQWKADEIQSKEELASRMMGRSVSLDIDRTESIPGEEVLRIEHLSGPRLDDVNLVVREGEVMALVGVAGNGQKELVETVAGLRPPGAGRVAILSREWADFFANPSWKETLSYIPEDRLGLAVCREMTLTDNFLLTTRQGFCRGMWLQRKAARETVARKVKEFNVQPGRPDMAAGRLSGGNLQKLVLAREFYRNSRLIVAEQPTQGLDVSSTEEVWRQLLQARAHAGILLVTGDLREAVTLADRIAVIFRGRIMDDFSVDDTERMKRIGMLMAGAQ
ncbi:ABC transporter ATP-binding protein [Desulfonatronum parangueonense]